ncbi:MAG: enoyl-CoA hydratase/carnithine racemase [Bacteroidia bacterium]
MAIITNNDAPINRMTLGFIDELETGLPQLAEDHTVRAIILRGAGEDSFSVGMNLKQLGEGKASSGSHQLEGMMAFLEKRKPDFSSDPK